MISPISYNFFPKNKRQDKLNQLAISFTSKVKTVHQGSLPSSYYNEVDKFEETHSNADYLGAGLFARAYVFKGTPYVIKESLEDDYAKEANKGFYQEAAMLTRVPDKMKTSQKLIAHVETERGNCYLLSTLVAGGPADCQKRPWTTKSFQGLLRSLYDLDEAGIYHNDVNQANCLLDNVGNVNILDYQFGTTFSPYNTSENSKNFKCTSFQMPSNAQMFEMASLPFYLKDMGRKYPKKEVSEVFKAYLNAKSDYCKQRALHLSGMSSEKSKYEALQAKFYKRPSDDMVNLQALKLQLMYAHRKTFSIVDPNGQGDKNIMSAIPSYIYTATCAKKFTESAKALKSKTTGDPDLKEFLDYEIKFGEYWQNQMLTELMEDHDGGVLDWVQRNAKLAPKHDYDYCDYDYSTTDLGVPKGEDLRHKFKAAEDMEFGHVDDIAALIQGTKPNNNKYSSVSSQINSINKACTNFKEKVQKPQASSFVLSKNYQTTLIKLSLLNEKYKDSCNQMFSAIGAQAYNTAIPASIKATYYAALFEEKADEEYSKSSDTEFRNYLTEQKKTVDKYKSSSLTSDLCRMFASAIKSPYDEPILDNINEFEIK